MNLAQRPKTPKADFAQDASERRGTPQDRGLRFRRATLAFNGLLTSAKRVCFCDGPAPESRFSISPGFAMPNQGVLAHV